MVQHKTCKFCPAWASNTHSTKHLHPENVYVCAFHIGHLCIYSHVTGAHILPALLPLVSVNTLIRQVCLQVSLVYSVLAAVGFPPDCP